MEISVPLVLKLLKDAFLAKAPLNASYVIQTNTISVDQGSASLATLYQTAFIAVPQIFALFASLHIS